MQGSLDHVGRNELLCAVGLAAASIAAAFLLHLGAGPEAPDNPGAAAQLAAAAAPRVGAQSAARESE
jgi:hypothetical protein